MATRAELLNDLMAVGKVSFFFNQGGGITASINFHDKNTNSTGYLGVGSNTGYNALRKLHREVNEII